MELDLEKLSKGAKNLGKEISNDPVGKTLKYAGYALVGIGLLGLALKVGAFTMDCYNDFRDASKR
jgi:hypothetical protein